MKKEQTTIAHILFACLFFLLSYNGHAQSEAKLPSIFEHLTSKEGVKMTLETDLTTIISNKKTNQYFPGNLITSEGQTFKIELKPRGKYRRKVSEIPPLKIKFKKKDLKGEGLDTLNEIKLVLPCYDNDLGDQLLVKEYIAYRMFEKLTGASVRARLIRLTIRDTHVESKKTMLAILLEDEEETVVRLNGQLVEQYGIPADSLFTNQAALVAMFEYMIGNTDWEIAMMRNVRLIRSMEKEDSKVLVVPYDFDFSGLVSAPYSSPASETGLKTVRDRFLMSNGLKPESLKKAARILVSAKKDFYDLLNNKYLSRSSTQDMATYLNTFFEQMDASDEIPQILKMPPSD